MLPSSRSLIERWRGPAAGVRMRRWTLRGPASGRCREALLMTPSERQIRGR